MLILNDVFIKIHWPFADNILPINDMDLCRDMRTTCVIKYMFMVN